MDNHLLARELAKIVSRLGGLSIDIKTLQLIAEAATSLLKLRDRKSLCACMDGYCSACRLRDIIEDDKTITHNCTDTTENPDDKSTASNCTSIDCGCGLLNPCPQEKNNQ